MWCCRRFFEPVRDVSFIDNLDERLLIQDFINSCDKAKAWSSIRNNNIPFDTMCKIRLGLKYKHKDFFLMLQLMRHMATDWDEWVDKRKETQIKEQQNRDIIKEWSAKHKWNEKANNVLLLAYMENLLALADKLDAYPLVEKILFDLEISLARISLENMESYKNYISSVGNSDLFKESMEYKMEICKIVTEINLPITYKFTKERWVKNKEYVKSCEAMKKILGDLQKATITENMENLKKALEFGADSPIKTSEIYLEAEAMLDKLRLSTTEVAI